MKLTVDPEKCTMCGACIPTCPTEMVRSKGDFIKIGRVACIECGHCISICPEGAIEDEEGCLTPQPLSTNDRRSSGEGGNDTAPLLKALIQRRRTVRRYKADPVAHEIIADLLDAARWAPTAANCQAQEYLAITDHAVRDGLRHEIESHYRGFAEALADKEMRSARLAALGLDGEFATHPHMLAAVPAFVKAVDAGRDRLFFEAPVVIIVHAAINEVMPEAACAFATLALVLMAEAHGLGTCITGYASDALRQRSDIRKWLGLPESNQVHYVVALGWPEEQFLRVPERRPAKVEWKGSNTSGATE